MIEFANRLKLLRKQKKLTQVYMAKLLDCTEQHYQRLEYGKVTPPATTLIALSDFFEVSIDYLVGRTDDSALH